jgi:hypothetical protein
LNDQFLILYITWCQFQDLTNSHSTPGHQLQDNSVPDIHRSENNFVDGLLINDLPLDAYWPTEYFLDNWCCTMICQFRGSGIDCEIVERRKS